MLKIYNSLSRKKEEFIPLEENKVKMYACGITVSGQAHIGHAIQAMVFDIIRKYFEKKGYEVLYARNYTDVDDKIIINAKKLGVDPMVFASENIKEIDSQMDRFGVDRANLELKATENIDNIINFVKQLIEKGYAYATENGDVYFSVKKFNGYGKLSNRTLEDAFSGVRIENEENKNNPLDFALWKSAKEGEIFWESPWGKGRPGWHIECSAMNLYHLGEQIDIHGGGRDLIFPHHENEIAQTEALTGKLFAKYWLHNGLIKINGQKMSKSLGNSIFLKDLLDKYHPEVIRFALLQTNYKNDLNIIDGLFEESEKHMKDFYSTFKKVEDLNLVGDEINPIIDNEFNDAMDDDFNCAKALGNLFGYFKLINNKISAKDESVMADYNAIKKTYSLLGLFKSNSNDFLKNLDKTKKIPQIIIDLAEKRLLAKKERNYNLADELRSEINKKGFQIKDTANGYEIE